MSTLVLIAVCCGVNAEAVDTASGLHLTGTVQSDAGTSLSGATVFISSCAPRKGVGVLCPSCYPDCEKRVVTDDQGRFILKDVDPELVFKILAFKDGFVPTYSEKHVDPQQEPPVLTLKLHDLDRRDPELVLRGRVIDDTGKPVAAAVVDPEGYRSKNGGGRWGRLEGVDALAVTNEQGEFRIGVSEADAAWEVHVSARFLARKIFSGLQSGVTVHQLALNPGTTVSGTVMHHGKPVPGVGLGLCQTERRAGVFLGDYTIATQPDGSFVFMNVPSTFRYYIYGLMDSCKAYGAIPATTITPNSVGQILDVGTLEFQRGYRLSGRVVLSDGKPVPENTQVMIGRDDAWDTQRVITAADGSFLFEGLPPERYGLYANVRDYHASPKNGSFELLNRGGLAGMVKADISGLLLLLDPGPIEPLDRQKFERDEIKEYQRRKESPLRGASLSPE